MNQQMSTPGLNARRCRPLLALLAALLAIPYATVRSATPTAVLMVDGVRLSLTAPALPGPFVSPDPDSALQVATAASVDPFREVSLTAAPYGGRPAGEALPAAGRGLAERYRGALWAIRRGQGANPEAAPTANLFGQAVIGSQSLVSLPIGGQLRPVRIAEWVAEAGQRIWILRAAEEVAPGTAAEQGAFAGLCVSSPDVSVPSSSRTARARPLAPTGTAPALWAAADLPAPGWWYGDCDTDYYQAQGGTPAYALGAAYRGVKACGPRPWADGAPDVLVRFYPAAWGEYEWECVELSMRYLYLAYGIAPYGANGNQVVDNYRGTRLVKVYDGTVGEAPQPGDVLSLGVTSTYGHTVVVAAAQVDTTGNGWIDTVSQNDSATGWRRYAVTNWHVASSSGTIGWLHDAQGDPPSPPTSTPTPTATTTPTPTPTPSPTPRALSTHGFLPVILRP